MDARAPHVGFFNDHRGDQLPNLLRRPSSSNLRPDSGDQPPVQTKLARCQRTTVSGVTMMRGCFQARPDLPSNYPEELIEEANSGEDVDASARRVVDATRDSRKGDFAARERGEPEFRSRAWRSVTWSGVIADAGETAAAMLLISQSARVLANDTSSGSYVEFHGGTIVPGLSGRGPCPSGAGRGSQGGCDMPHIQPRRGTLSI